MVLLIDNYDSFTYNLVQLFESQSCKVLVIRNDHINLDSIIAEEPKYLVISPGPGNTSDGGISEQAIKKLAGQIPILGVCLGMQIIGCAYGAELIHAERPVHGETAQISHNQLGLFEGLPLPLQVARYHSLRLEAKSCQKAFHISASLDETVMAIEHKTIPYLQGVQFHPESFLTEGGETLIKNFLNQANHFLPRHKPKRYDNHLFSEQKATSDLDYLW